jgi:PAS domain S-box-containing protein
MGIVAWVGYGLGYLGSGQLTGVIVSILALILMNPLTLWVLARAKNLRFIKYFSLGVNLVEVTVYTAVIHFVGGLTAAYLCTLYFVLIAYLGMTAPRRVPFLIAGWCVVCLLGMVVLETTGLLPLPRSPILTSNPDRWLPWHSQLLIVGAIGVVLMVMAYVSSSTAGVLRRGRQQLRQINLDLERELDQRRQDQEELRHTRDLLETRVAERTAELLELNRRLTEEILERKQTELALRESQVRYVLATEAGRVGVWEWDLTTGEFYLDPFIKQRLGYEEDELHKFTREWFAQVTHPEERQQWIDLALLISQGRIDTFENEYRVVAKDGDIQWILTRGSVVRDEAGTPRRVIGTSMEITNRKRMEEAIQQSEARYYLATEAARVGVWDWDLKTGRFESDPRVWRELGYEPDQFKELTTEWGTLVVHPDDRAKMMETALAVQQGQLDDFEVEFRARHVDGRYTWYLSRASVIRDEAGVPIKVVGATIDINDRKQVEAKLQASELKFNAAFKSSPAIVSLSTLDEGRFLDVNENFLEVLGYTRAEVIGHTAEELSLWPNPLDRRQILASMKDGDIRNVEVPMRHKSAAIRQQLWSGTVIEMDGQRFLLTSAVDITDRIKAEQERDRLIAELRQALDKVQTLHGLIPICAYCKKVRDDEGYWHQVEAYLKAHSAAEFSHGLCPDCIEEHYPDYAHPSEAEEQESGS